MHQRRFQMRVARRAFSLIELLVVIGVIVVLIGIVVPSLAHSIATARRLVCTSNLRQIAALNAMYQDRHAGKHPPFGATTRWGVAPDKASWLQRLLDDNSESEQFPPKFAICPSNPDRKAISYFMSARWAFVRNRANLREQDIAYPSLFLLHADCTRLASYSTPFGTASLPFDDADKDDGRAESLLFSGDSGGFVMHGRVNAAVCADGHADIVKSHDDLTLDPTQSRATWADVK